jgi:hypothetical protein
MPWASAVWRASARKASNLGLPEPGWAGGGAGFVTEAGTGGGADLGGLVAQAATRRPPHRAASRFRPVRAGGRRVMADFVHRFDGFFAEKLGFLTYMAG